MKRYDWRVHALRLGWTYGEVADVAAVVRATAADVSFVGTAEIVVRHGTNVTHWQRDRGRS